MCVCVRVRACTRTCVGVNVFFFRSFNKTGEFMESFKVAKEGLVKC